MKQLEIRIPAMGEGITEASIIKYLKNVGDLVIEDDILVEIATDKIDTEIVAPKSGRIEKFLFKEGEIAQVGDLVVIINIEAEENSLDKSKEIPIPLTKEIFDITTIALEKPKSQTTQVENILYKSKTASEKYLSPLVRNIASIEGIALNELDKISGTGLANRITKEDVLSLANKKNKSPEIEESLIIEKAKVNIPTSNSDEIVEMDRMRKLIASYMIESKKISAHVTSFVEVDLTAMVTWRNMVKETFYSKYKEKITFTPVFIEAIVQAIKEFPMINVSVDNTNIIVKKQINIGMATALPSGNLIVPVIKNAAELSLLGITKKVNDLADRARSNKLKPDEIQGGTFTITNLGTFGNITGTPIINQPEVAIIAIGAIKKKPVVIESPLGDTIGIRQMMIMSMSYDHRVVDGALGGMFLKRVADILESFDLNKEI